MKEHDLNPDVVPIDQLEEKFEEIRKSGATEISYDMAMDIFKSSMNELAPLLSYILFSTKEAQNYLRLSFASHDGKQDFNIILQRKGGELPPV